MVEIFDRSSIALIPWPQTAQGQWARHSLTPFLLNGTQHYVSNVVAEPYVVVYRGVALPLMVTRGGSGNAYVCSQYSHYVAYAQEELHKLNRPGLQAALSVFLGIFGLWLRLGKIDHAAYLGNHLVSTNLYPELTAQDISVLSRAITQMFPDLAVVVRSVHDFSTGQWDAIFTAAGFRLIPSRSVLFMDPASNLWQKRDVKKDLKLLKNTPYTLRKINPTSDTELSRAKALYDLLYLEKYSRQNPQFTAAYFRLCGSGFPLELYVLEKDNHIDGVFGMFSGGPFVAAPILGYDTRVSASAGLYRQLSMHLLLKARDLGKILHASSGVADFKRLRGAEPALEYTAVDTRHLSCGRRWVWRSLEWVVRKIALPLIQKNGL